MAQDDRNAAYLPGPLDELVPGLRRKLDRLPALPVHPRVVRPQNPDGTHSIVLLSFRAAQNARALHAALKPMVEAALLSELCAPASELAERYTPLSDLTLLVFADHGFDLAPALTPFGFERVEAPGRAPAQGREGSAGLRSHPRSRAEPPASTALAPLLALARREAHTLAEPVPDEPIAVYRVGASPSEHELARRLHAALREYAPKTAWGREPGLLARTLADWLATQAEFDGVAPSRAGIERLESLVVHTRPGMVRWIEPLVFQALCDLVAVMAASRAHLRTEWGVSEPDENGLAPPPVLRITRDDECFHVPLGEHVLRWCIMPMRASEQVPSLGAWAEHEFV